MTTKTKFASNNVVCVFGDYAGISVHLGNIDLRTNRLYTTVDGYDILASNCFKQNHKLRFFNEESIEDGDCFNYYNYHAKSEYNKFTACVDLQKDEISDVIKMCNHK